GEMRLRIACDSQSELLFTQPIPLHYRSAARSVNLSLTTHLWALEQPHHFLAITLRRVWNEGSREGAITVYHDESDPNIIPAHTRSLSDMNLAMAHHAFVQRGDRGYLGVGCTQPRCETLTLDNGAVVELDHIYVIDLREPITA